MEIDGSYCNLVNIAYLSLHQILFDDDLPVVVQTYCEFYLIRIP